MRTSSASQSQFFDALARTWKRRRELGARELPPRHPGLPLVGSILDIHDDALAMFERGLLEQGDTVRYRLGPFELVAIHRPEDIRTVLLERAGDMARSPNYEGLRLVLGQGLLTSDGEFWKRQRKLATPAFHHKRLLELCDTMVRCTVDLGEGWSTRLSTSAGRGPADATVDVHAAMMALTFRIVGLTLFSTELSHDAGDAGPALTTVLEHANFTIASMQLAPPPWVPTPRNRRFNAAKRVLDDVVERIIRERRALADHDEAALPNDLLSMLMRATDETGRERMSDVELRDEIMTLVLAGHETTAQALSWTLMLLSQHPAVERALVDEVREVCGDRPPTMADLDALAYTGRVIDESMRLYPPAWIFERLTKVDLELGGYFIPAETMIAIVPWTLHRHPRLWDNPEGFDPDRFTEARSQGRPRYAYLPFGGGPRQCIGLNFARYEAKLVLATLIQRFRFELLPGQDLRPEPSVTLRPRHGLKMRLSHRPV
ncbi:cytochrome P450 [Pseudenhygromyxa sp. WMMC2535]|uniref:cytochrome P450 n=1 Tax=Pseudenhygromyxa sp. WMMC2535 TaxID=2712867 RepID=UPI0015549B5B|nr:cytochrome P450 [Pseudenhygromyxa sp. WMMC2535]NVB37118.1 cytochrome P450 [Pseudenhygromyxa sp. WMMC2535]